MDMTKRKEITKLREEVYMVKADLDEPIATNFDLLDVSMLFFKILAIVVFGGIILVAILKQVNTFNFILK